ncbi:MAG: hypothetical protein JXA07_02850 [Spirochaetes bacterium]|nr:hypothetical protein [Spirochaetota bacterium]
MRDKKVLKLFTLISVSIIFISLTPVDADINFQLKSSIEQNGISCFFSQKHHVGKFVNGDYWVVGPVMLTRVSAKKAPEKINDYVGIMINPRVSNEQGYDSRSAGYNPALAVTLPRKVNPGDSIVLTTSLKKIGGNEGTFLYDAIVITIVDAPQSGDKFRPPYSRPSRLERSGVDPLIYSSNDLVWDYLKSLPKPFRAPSLRESARLVERVWLDHWKGAGFIGSRIHPLNNMRDYGRDIAANLSEVALQLMLDYSREEKNKLLISLVQIGIDFYGIALDGGVWIADGGHNSGRKFPIVFAGLLLNNSDMLNIQQKFYRKNKSIEGYQYRFAEDGQTYYYDDAYLPDYADVVTNRRAAGVEDKKSVAVKGVRGWIGKLNGGKGDAALWRLTEWTMNGTYVAEHEHIPLELWQPLSGGSDSHPKSESYRRCCTSKAWIGYCLALRLMGEKAVQSWNHNAFFDYCYRFMEEDDSMFTALLAKKYKRSYDARQGSSLTEFVDDMWKMYGKKYIPFKK